MAVAVLSKWRWRQKLCVEEAFKVYSFSFKLLILDAHPFWFSFVLIILIYLYFISLVFYKVMILF